MTISRRLPDLAPYYRLVKSAAAAGARSVADWIGARPQRTAAAPDTRADSASIAVEQGYVRGWIVDAAGTEGKPLRVFLDGKLIGVVTADLPLPKIGRRFELPTVRYGFRFPIPPTARDGASHAIAVQTLDKRARRTIRFVAPPDGDGPRIELLAVSENGVRGVLRNGYDAAEGPELWVGDRKLVWPAAVARLTPREDLATVFEIDLLKTELGALLGRGLRLAVPGGHDVDVTTSLVDLLGVRFARLAPETLRVTTEVAVPHLDGVAFQIELSAEAGFTGATHRAAVALSAASANVASPASFAGRAIWARLVLVAGRDRTASAARYVPAHGEVSRPLYAFDPAMAGEPQIWRDPPSGAELVQGAYVQYDASTSETCAISLSAPSDDRPATLTCDAAAGGAGVRLCFPVPLGTTQAGDRIMLAFAARSRPDGAHGIAFTLMSSRGPTLAKAFEAALDRPPPKPGGWMRRDVALVLGECAHDDFLDLVVEIEPGAGVEIERVSAEVVAADLGAGAPGEGRKIRIEAAPRTVGAVWFDGEAVVGWAVDETDPRRPVTVEIAVDGQPAGRVAAIDLHPVLIGREHNYGRCAFRIAAPTALRDGERHVVEARALHDAVLPGSPMTVRMAPLGPARPQNEAQRRIAVGDPAHAVRFVALRTAATAPGERRDVLERDTEAPRNALFDEEIRRLISDLARASPQEAGALAVALDANETDVARRAAAFAADEEPLVSIVMPTFNRAFVIADAIQSVIDQSWSNWELIVCDDGSADKTAAVVKGFGDPRIRYLPLEKSNGAVARNFGLRFSRGGFIAFLDTDNVWHPDFLRMCVAALSASAAPFCFTAYVDAAIRGARYASGEIRTIGFDYLALLDRNAIGRNAIMLRASVYETLGGFDERLQRAPDWDLLLRYGLMFEPLAIHAVGALYRRNPAWSHVTDLAGHTDDHEIVRDKALAALKAEPAVDGAKRSQLTIVADGENDTDIRLLAGVMGEAADVHVADAAHAPSGAPVFTLLRDGETFLLTDMRGDDRSGFVVGRLTAASAALDAGAPPIALGLAPSPVRPVMALVPTTSRTAWATALLARSRDGGPGLLIAGGGAAAFENGTERTLSADAATLARAAVDCHAVILAGAEPVTADPFRLRAMRDGVPIVGAGGDACAEALQAPAEPAGALAFVDALASDAYALAEITARARRRYDYSYRPSRLRQRTVAYLALLHSAEREPATTPPTRVPALPRRPITAAIKISAPTLDTAQGWGDFHFANALRGALQRLGWVVRVDCRDEWEQACGDEVTLTLRGRNRYRGAADALNLLWVISHPDKLTPQETADYAHVFVASDIFANMLRTRTATPVSVLHQATDPAVFHPPEEPVAVTAPALFVGNSRREYRAMVRWCVEAGIDLHVFGQLWNGLIPDRMILGEHVANADLHRWYGATPILLNDHWDTMRAMGFLSNRLFDGSAAGAFIITDPVRGLAPVFGDAIETASDAAELKDKVAFYLAHPEEAREKAERARAIVLAGHTFDDRARTIVSVCEAAAARRSAP